MSQPHKRTALYQNHLALGARMIPFAGWEMPIQYDSILNEARAVRKKGGVFDVSHMGRIYISGQQSTGLMDWIQTGHIGTLREGRARYSLICNENGGIIDDTVTYRLNESQYLLVCNAGNRESIIDWIDFWRGKRYPDTTVNDVTLSTVMIAVQGPSTPTLMDNLCPQQPSTLRFFSKLEGDIVGRTAFVGRTGYTGEDGFEVILSDSDGPQVWELLIDQGMLPCGLGSRDILRMEAGLALHGTDIDSTTTPLEAGLGRFVKLDKDFVGADILRHQQTDLHKQLVGLIVEGRSLPRHHYPIQDNGKLIGAITSGGYSPTLDSNIGMGYVSHGFASPGQNLQVDIRGNPADAIVVPLPFYTRKRDQ